MKGICFIEPLFHAGVSGQKTHTRRLIKSSTGFFNVESTREGVITSIWKCDADGWNGEDLIPVMPKYKVGEVVYLKEPYVLYYEQYQELRTNASGIQFAYKYGNNISVEEITGKSDSKWSNKLFMPESAARYFIQITAVRAERLQDISEEDCVKEGISLYDDNGKYLGRGYIDTYAALIDKINGKGTWESNPFVWVYDFKLVKK